MGSEKSSGSFKKVARIGQKVTVEIIADMKETHTEIKLLEAQWALVGSGLLPTG